MPGDPSNPFNDQLAQLNGITFDQGDLGDVHGKYYVGNDFQAYYGVYTNHSIYHKIPGQIHVVDYTYIGPGGNAGNNSYKPPVFGIVTFDNIFKSDGVTPLEFSIRGFSDEMLLLSPMYSGDNPQYDLGHMIVNSTFLLSDTGFSSFTFPVTFGYDPTVYQVPACFAEGTRIATPSGPVLVEALAIGDRVLTASGDTRPVKWIAHTTLRPERHPRPNQLNPVRVKAGAFGEGLPARDLRLSPGHAVFVDGVLVPVGQLLNGATIVQDAVETIRYFHVELDSHDVLLAEGLACESYLDDGNRQRFANACESVELFGRLDPQSWENACAPVIGAGPQLTEIQQRLAARAEALGWMRSEQANIAVTADGATIAPLHRAGNRYWFSVPGTERVTLCSDSGVLAQVLPGLGDSRKLGVAVASLRVNGVALDLDDAAFGTGFHPAEQHGESRWRWTDGEATLALAAAEPAMIEVEVAMVAPCWVRPMPALRVVA